MRKETSLLNGLMLIFFTFISASTCLSQTSAQILFTSKGDDLLGKIYLMNATGGNAHRVGSLPGCYGHPEFSKDNKKILFDYSTGIISDKQIYIMNADGSDPKALTFGPSSSSGAKFTGDNQIVFSQTQQKGPAARYIMHGDGSDKKPFSFRTTSVGDVGDSDSFSFGPDGMILFAEHVMVQNVFLDQIFKVSTINGQVPQLIYFLEDFRLPVWCPDGSKIAYVDSGLTQAFATPNHEHDGIYLINSDGTNVVCILKIDFSQTVDKPASSGNGPGKNPVQLSREPSFSPDGKRLTFSLNKEGDDQVYVINTDGSGLVRLTSS